MTNPHADAIRACVACRLSGLRDGWAVPGVGPVPARIMLLAEAPGAQEAATGVPLVGPAGRLLDGCLAEIGLTRGDVFVTNRVRCRPPMNRLDDYPDAVLACNRWSAAEVAATGPAVVVLMGETAALAAFKEAETCDVKAPHLHPWSTTAVWIQTVHPAACLPGRNPEYRDRLVAALQRAKEIADSE